MAVDIRDKPYLYCEDVIGLNFIKDPGPYVFRRHYRHGLRSHIMEVLDKRDVERERRGIVREGIRWYPRARPVKMLRIFRAKFKRVEEVFEEIKRVKIIEDYLAPDNLALSDEFIVDYISHRTRDFILCGLQEYVEGEVLDPWSAIDINHLSSLLGPGAVEQQADPSRTEAPLSRRLQKKAEEFITKIKNMILDANYVPDLAGVENLLITRTGDVRLVDINNISKVIFGPTIPLDDRGYPVCDKSIEALSLLEQKLLVRPIDMDEIIYRIFLDPERMKQVSALEEKFRTP